MFPYDALIARLDDGDLQQLLGRGAVRLIQVLESDRTAKTSLADLPTICDAPRQGQAAASP